nr:MAG TPA: MarR family transcriptional regulator, transcription factor, TRANSCRIPTION REGULATOR.05A [Caudoviricetes sp.]
MTKLTDKACKLHGLLMSEGLALLAISSTNDETYKSLIDKGLITKANGTMQSLNRKFSATDKGISLANELLADSEENIANSIDSIEELASKLIEIYPSGRKPGTSYYYKGNKADIVRKLKSFYKRYGEFSSEQIIEATQRYIDSFNGDYTYLRLLKYFIWKDEVKDGETLQISQLADWINNANQVNDTNSDWTTNLN